MGGSESNKRVFIITVEPPNKGHYGSTVFERSSLSRRSNNISMGLKQERERERETYIPGIDRRPEPSLLV